MEYKDKTSTEAALLQYKYGLGVFAEKCPNSLINSIILQKSVSKMVRYQRKKTIDCIGHKSLFSR